MQLHDIMAVVYKRFCTFSSLLKKPRRVDDGILPAPCGPVGLPGQRCLPGAGSAHATGIRRPLQPPVVVASNPATLIKKTPRTLSGTGLFLQGWTLGFEPTTTGTTIRGSTAELRPPLVFALACGSNIHAVKTDCKPNFVFGLKFVHH